MKKLWKQAGVILMISTLFLACGILLQGSPAYAKVKLSKKTVYMTPGSSLRLKVKGTSKKAKWLSKNKKIATVSKKGKIKAKKVGETTIVAKVKGKKYKCKVIVEKKTNNRARKLRNYIISKGKYNKKDKSYSLKWTFENDSEGGDSTATISAFKNNNDLEFSLKEYLIENIYDNVRTIVMRIDLITGTSSLKTGSVMLDFDQEYDPSDKIFDGKITTSFDGKKTGLTLTKVQWKEYVDLGEGNYKYESKESDQADVISENKESAYYYLNYAFAKWSKMITKKHTKLKKDGISMKSIGFGKWK